MRIALMGYSGPLPPITLALLNGIPFVATDYLDLGYTNYDVVCVGGAGGRGASLDGGGWNIQRMGGAGGGGGLHRVQGVLSELPSPCSVLVGSSGINRPTYSSDDITLADDVAEFISEFLISGGSGESSSFNDTTCRASGGIGGTSVSVGEGVLEDAIVGVGGSGGLGDSITPGGGAVTEEDGTFDGTIGSGGGGGTGGTGHYVDGDLDTDLSGGSGGRGSYSVEDSSFTGPATPPDHALPGVGGGARATLLNGNMYVYGSVFGANITGKGAVIVRLTRV